MGDLDAFGYVQEEYFLERVANSYRPVGELGPDGHWTVGPASTAAYKTRLVVLRPKDMTRFSDVVAVEWNNVTAGSDFIVLALPGMLHSGRVHVAVTTQKVGIHGLPDNPRGLHQWDPVRYDSLVHPGDSFSFDIYSQAGRLFGPDRRVGDVDPL